jgi:hypothetical protein
MTRDQVIETVFDELRKAEIKHPSWPTDPIHAAAIVAEEAGELVQASIDHYYMVECKERMMKEAAQTAAMGIRLLINLADANDEDICGFCGKPGADKIPHPVLRPGENRAGTELVHAECENEECNRAHSLLSDKQREEFLRNI